MVTSFILDRWERSHLEEGFHFDDCEPVHANSIEHNVEWKKSGLESLQPVFPIWMSLEPFRT